MKIFFTSRHNLGRIFREKLVGRFLCLLKQKKYDACLSKNLLLLHKSRGLKISYIYAITLNIFEPFKCTIDAAFRKKKKLSGQNGTNSVGCYLRLDQKEHGENLDLINTFNSV